MTKQYGFRLKIPAKVAEAFNDIIEADVLEDRYEYTLYDLSRMYELLHHDAELLRSLIVQAMHGAVVDNFDLDKWSFDMKWKGE